MVQPFAAQNELFQLRLKAQVDFRQTACKVNAVKTKGGAALEGFVHYRPMLDFVREMAVKSFGDSVEMDVQVLTVPKAKFAQVTGKTATFWKGPDTSDSDDLQTEALLGAVVRVFHSEGDFLYAQHPDGYLGYVPQAALSPVSSDAYLRWKNGTCAIAKTPLKSNGISVPVGARLVYENGRIVLPNGDEIKAARKDVIIRSPSEHGLIKTVEQHVENFKGTPYLWGGKTETGIDCSGFMQSLALQHGIILPRDASMQAHVGEMVGNLLKFADLLPGDLMFFMNKSAYIFHVGMYLGDMKYVHSSGKHGVAISSVLPKGENYLTRYGTSYVFSRRVF